MSAQTVTVTSANTKNIVSGIRSLTIQNIVNSSLSTVFLALLLRLLSPAEFGLYSATVLVTLIGTSIASFGLQIAATRFVAFMSFDDQKSKAVSRSILILSLIFASLSTVVLVLISPNLSVYFTRSTSSAWIFAASGAWLFSGTMSGIFQGLVQGMKRYDSLAKILMSAGTVMVCLTVVGLHVLNSVVIPILAWGIYGAVICLWSYVIVRKGVAFGNSSVVTGQSYRQLLKYSIPLGIAGIVTVATGIADPMVVGGLLSEAQLGAYNAAIAISGGLGVMFFAPLNTAFFPETSSVAHDHVKLKNGMRLAFRYAALALIPVSFALAGLSTQMMNLFSGGGASYLEANLSLQLMSLFFVFVAMQGIPTSLLLSLGRTTQVMLIGIATVLLDLFLSEVMVPNLGLLGATTSRILVDVAGFLMAAYLTRTYFKDVMDIGFYTKVVAISFVMFLVLFSLSHFVSNSTVTLVPYILLGSAVLILCVRGSKLLSEEDMVYLEHFVHPKARKLIRLIA